MAAPERLSDERLAWLAAKPYCDQRARKVGARGWLAVVLSVFGLGTAVERREGYSDAMALYGIAVDDVSRKLTAEERPALRTVGVLPGWFLPAVEQRFNDLRAQRRG